MNNNGRRNTTMSHTLTINNIEKLSNGNYNVSIEGYDAMQNRHFSDLITVQDGSFFRGNIINPKLQPLSNSCIALIKTEIMKLIKEL